MTEPGFTEEWFSPHSCRVLAGLVVDVADVEGRIVEIGSWEGRSTVALASAAAPRLVHAVDTWEGSVGEISAELAAGRDVFAQWRANVDAYTGGNVLPWRMDWRAYHASTVGACALVFIDALHTYEEVRDQIAAFRPLIPPGGVMCGDDVHHPPIQRAVLEAFGHDGNVGQSASLWIWRNSEE